MKTGLYKLLDFDMDQIDMSYPILTNDKSLDSLKAEIE